MQGQEKSEFTVVNQSSEARIPCDFLVDAILPLSADCIVVIVCSSSSHDNGWPRNSFYSDTFQLHVETHIWQRFSCLDPLRLLQGGISDSILSVPSPFIEVPWPILG